MKNDRLNTRKVSLGVCHIGGGEKIAIQSMTNTDTNDVERTVAQVKRIVEAGADIVRISVPSMKEVKAMEQIKSRLKKDKVNIPIVADVHFNPDIALALADVVEKIRINPGNYVDRKSSIKKNFSENDYTRSLELMAKKARPLLEKCKKFGTAVRVGVNHGSLCDRIVNRYGNGPLGMAMSAMEWVELCNAFGFHDLVFSLKASNPFLMAEATLLFKEKMSAKEMCYPLHIGVTEAGAQLDGRVKSAAGAGVLLHYGLGDTVRISLTEEPENEVLFAQALLKSVQNTREHYYSLKDGVLNYTQQEPDRELWIAGASAMSGYLHFQNQLKDIVISNSYFSDFENQELSDAILQACRIKMVKAEIVSCPTCARTQYDIEEALKQVKERFSKYTNLKIGVMGCVVNGPGEMADADYGIVGAAQSKVIAYQGKKQISAPVSVEEALLILEKNISEV